jgi:hypothetical protein
MIPATSHTGYFYQACLSRRPQAGEKNFFEGSWKNTKNIYLYFSYTDFGDSGES